MRILLLRPDTRNRFGLGPFFRTEPLGLEYLTAALRRSGHRVTLRDLRFARGERALARLLARERPEVVGISCIHVVDVPPTRELARAIRRAASGARIVVGGHAVSAAPELVLGDGTVDAVCVGPGERSFPDWLQALGATGSVPHVAGFVSADGPRAPGADAPGIDPELAPARDAIAEHRRGYRCVHRSPVWVVETARGCPFRCSFCSVARAGPVEQRSLDAVRRDFVAVGANVFVVDDLFFHPRERSLELARELARAGVRKPWLLVQTRTDTIVRNAAALEAWRPLAERFDLFVGFEAASDAELGRLNKDAAVSASEQAVQFARSLGFGLTGNFVVDPDWGEADFERLWAFVDRLTLDRAGYTVLTPLPGTALFDAVAPRLADRELSHFDMHHALTEPRLGRRRFYELFVESWRRNVLAARHGLSRWPRWFRGLSARDALALVRVLRQTQRLLDVQAYLEDAPSPALPALLADLPRAAE